MMKVHIMLKFFLLVSVGLLILYKAYQVWRPRGGGPFSDLSIYSASQSAVCREPSSGDPRIFGKGICYNEKLNVISFIQFTNWTQLDICAVTTALYHNPKHAICVLQAEGVILDRDQFKKWAILGRIQVVKLEPTKLVSGTAVEEWYRNSCLSPDTNGYLMSQVADGFRFVYVYKYGGISLDTDVLALKTFPNFTNTLGLEDGFTSMLNNAVFTFEKGNPFLTQVVNQFPNFAKPNWYASGGPWLLSNVYRQRIEQFGHQDTVRGFLNIVPPFVFYPFYWDEGIPKPFLAAYYKEVEKKCRYSVTMHLYRSTYTKFMQGNGKAERGSFVDKYLRRYCS